jgi:hypothetical protein
MSFLKFEIFWPENFWGCFGLRGNLRVVYRRCEVWWWVGEEVFAWQREFIRVYF